MQTILGVLKSKKGLSTLGSSKRITIEKTGKAWVGKNYKNIKDKSGNIIGYSSKDGMRAYRLQYKRKEEQWRANFTENYIYIIISPERLGKLIIGDEIELGRGYFITADYNKEKIIRRIENILESIQTNNEDKMFDELEKFFLSRI